MQDRTGSAALLQAMTGPAEMRRFQARELRERAAEMLRTAEAMEAEAEAMEAAANGR